MPRGHIRLAVLGVWLLPAVSAAEPPPAVDVRIRQAHLVALCLDGTPVLPTVRRWNLSAGPHTLSVTMDNAPRSGIAAADAGTATVAFTLEAGHRYEIEVRAPPASFSTRVWRRSEWSPVVRDRSTEQIVTGGPDGDAPSCR